MQPDLELKPTAGGRVVLVIFGLAMLAIGIAMMVLSRGRNQAPIGVLLAFGLVGLAIFALGIRIGARRLILTRDGVEVRGLFGAKRMAWHDIHGYSFSSVDVARQAGMQGGLVGVLAVAAVRAMTKKPANRKFSAGRLVLFGANNTKLTINAWFKDIDQGLERIFAEIHPRLHATTGPNHGKLSFDGNALSHPSKGVLALHEIDKVAVSPNGIVSVHKVGKRFAWATVNMASLTSSLILFERLTQRGVVVQPADAVFLPLPTLGLLNQMAAARQNLPQARIHQH